MCIKNIIFNTHNIILLKIYFSNNEMIGIKINQII